MARTPDKSVCPMCSGLGTFFVNDAQGRRMQALCGHSVCLGAMEDRITKRTIVEIFRFLPPDITAKAKR